MTQGRRGQITPKQLPDGRWRANVRLGSDPGTGKSIRKSVYGDTADEVMGEVIRLQHDHRRGLPVEAGRETIEQYLNRWLEESVKPRQRDSTYARYCRIVDHHLIPYIGRLRLDRLTPEHVESLITRLSQGGRRPRHKKEAERTGDDRMPPGLAANSVLLVRSVLRRALGQAVRRGHLARNVATMVDPPAAPLYEAASLTDDEAISLLKAAQGTRLEALVTVALALGLRQGETLGLTWGDIDLEGGEVRVWRQLKRIDGDWVLDELKTRGSRRDLPLPATVAVALIAHRDRQEFERRLAGSAWKGSRWPLVFPTSVGTPWSPRNLTASFHRLLVTAGLPSLPWHGLRHSAGSLLHARGVDLATIKAILGHSQIAVTANRYTHVASATKRAAADAMDAALTPRTRTGGQTGGRPTGTR